MAMLAVHHLDPVIGVDVHTVEEVPPAPPEPGVPTPHSHVGFVLDFREYVSAAMAAVGSIVFSFAVTEVTEYLEDNPDVAQSLEDKANKALGAVDKVASNKWVAAGLGAAQKAGDISNTLGGNAGYGRGKPIFVNGMLRATTGTHTYHVPGLHFPMGVSFVPPDKPPAPSSDAESFMGSKTVLANNDPMSYMALPALSCWFVGLEPMKHGGAHTDRTYLSLPTSVMLPIPAGRPVLVGGPPMFNMKAVMGALFKAFRGSALARELFKNKKSGFIKCKIFDAEPVNSVTGEVIVQQSDFTVQGRLPLQWDRYYASHDLYHGAAGAGWQTPADTRLELTGAEGQIGARACFADHAAPFEAFPSDPGWENRVYDAQYGHALYLLADRLVLRTSESLEYHYRLPQDWPQRLAALVAATAPATPDNPALTLPLTALTDLNGNAWQFERDTRQTLTRLVEYSGGAPTGRAIVCAAGDAPGKLGRLTLIDAQNNSYPLARYRQDAQGDLTAVEDALDQPYGFEYAAGHLMVRHTDRNGLSFYYSHQLHPDSLWRVDHAWGDGGLYDYRFVYDLEHLETRLTDSLGHATILQYNDQQKPVARIDPLGGVFSYQYDAQERTRAEIDPEGNATAWDYDGHGNLLCTTLPDGSRVSTDYNADHKPVCITDGEGGQWRQTWDSCGNLTGQTTPGGAATQYEYTGQGDLLRVTDPARQITTLYYDTLGFLAGLSDPAGQRTHFECDAQGNLLRKQLANGDVTTYRYDAKSRLIEGVLPDAKRIQCAYDAEDELTRYTDKAGRITRFSYYGQGRLQSRTDPDGSRVEYHYDTEEQLIAVTNQRGQRWQLKRDPVGRLAEETDYWGQARRYAYDLAGRITQSTDPLGQILTFTCDKLGRIVKKQASQQDAETYRYNKRGQLTGARNPYSTIERQYNRDGQLTQEKQQQPDAQGSIAYAYNPAGQLVEQTRQIQIAQTQFKQTQRIAYDALGQPESVQIDGDDPIRFTFDQIGRITGQQLSGRLAHHYRYNAAGRLAAQTSTLNGKLDTRIDYDYDDAGNLIQRRDPRLGADQFRYDLLGQIIAHTDPAGRVRQFVYDKTGDRFKTVQQSEEGRTLQHADGSFWRMDQAGQLTRRRDAQGRDTHLRWDAYGRLRHLLNHEQERYEYRYDALGRRICKIRKAADKTAPAEITCFLWDGDALAGEVKQTIPPHAESRVGWDELANTNIGLPNVSLAVDANTASQPPPGPQARFYTYYLGTFVPLALQTQAPEPARAGQAPVLTRALYFYQNDPNGMPVRLMDGQGEFVWEAYYSTFGQVEDLTVRRLEQPLRLQGQYCDEESGLHYNRYRYYDAEAGCFVSQDPIGLLGGLNPYRFAANVFGWIDPRGLFGEKPPNSPTLEKWLNRGGTVYVEIATGTWVYTNATGVTVRYPDGNPDFSPYAVQSVEVDDLRGNYSTGPSGDFGKADAAAIAKGGTGANYADNTWHHHENMTTMQEVPKELNHEFTHRGGAANIRDRDRNRGC